MVICCSKRAFSCHKSFVLHTFYHICIRMCVSYKELHNRKQGESIPDTRTYPWYVEATIIRKSSHKRGQSAGGISPHDSINCLFCGLIKSEAPREFLQLKALAGQLRVVFLQLRALAGETRALAKEIPAVHTIFHNHVRPLFTGNRCQQAGTSLCDVLSCICLAICFSGFHITKRCHYFVDETDFFCGFNRKSIPINYVKREEIFSNYCQVYLEVCKVYYTFAVSNFTKHVIP